MNSKAKKVLLIDDDQTILDLVDASLDGTEFKLFTTTDPTEGIRIARDIKPDVILLDIMMPKIDGYMASKIFKRNLSTKDIPIIFLTAKKTKEDIKKAIISGGIDYIAKPFDISDLLTKLRKAVELKIVKQVRKKDKVESSDAVTEGEIINYYEETPSWFSWHKDVIVFSPSIDSIVMDNCHIYRTIFSQFISDGFFKIIYDTRKLKRIDGAALALLILVNESVTNNGGEFLITYPPKEINNHFSFIPLNYLFHAFKDVEEALESFQKLNTNKEDIPEHDKINICLSCTYVNLPEARYCSNCGANLVLGKAESVIKILKKFLSKKILSEADDINKINYKRNIKPEESELPTEFNVELLTENLTLEFKSSYKENDDFKNKQLIAFPFPTFENIYLPVKQGMHIRLNRQSFEKSTTYETHIIDVDREKKIMLVHYPEDARILHSQKHFSIAPEQPIPINMMIPTIDYSGKNFKGKILEMSRVRMVIFSEYNIPKNQCLAVNFSLPDGQEISSPLVIAQKRKEKIMYNIDIIVIDEKERTKMIQYMYKRQIELAK
ncbi:MAG: response regulator [Candidatus Latescibacteria bacterium]|jgi:CheY-like chemotaxis protein/ABC-type transporter Mla MlaB component|nr:response regulator [Candidatus Latescibacterota bacterium]